MDYIEPYSSRAPYMISIGQPHSTGSSLRLALVLAAACMSLACTQSNTLYYAKSAAWLGECIHATALADTIALHGRQTVVQDISWHLTHAQAHS